MVFAKKNDDNLASLVKQLDKAVSEFEEVKLQAVVHLLGEDRDALLEEAKKIETKGIPVTVPVESETGPENWSINPEADLTVFTYIGKKVTASHGYVDVSKKDLKQILTSVKKIATVDDDSEKKDAEKKEKKARKKKKDAS